MDGPSQSHPLRQTWIIAVTKPDADASKCPRRLMTPRYTGDDYGELQIGQLIPHEVNH